jgi:hypothetical protein
MSNGHEVYVIDANVFIQAKRRFYPFDVCPGYWAALHWYCEAGRVCSVDKVRDELEHGRDNLWDWARSSFEAGFLNTGEVTEKYAEMVAWVSLQTQFSQAAKAEFATVADGWLVAHAKVNGKVLVTLEEFKPDAKSKVPLVNVCRAFDVQTISPFEMLRRLGIQFNWQPPNKRLTTDT